MTNFGMLLTPLSNAYMYKSIMNLAMRSKDKLAVPYHNATGCDLPVVLWETPIRAFPKLCPWFYTLVHSKPFTYISEYCS